MCLVCALVGFFAGYAYFVEPHWVCIKRIVLSPAPTIRVVHITDIHFKGDRKFLERIVEKINRIDADAVCFTGDLIEEASFLDDALDILSKVKKPLYGVPGNHDEGALGSFDAVRKAFRNTGGDWLTDRLVLMPSKRAAFVPLSAAEEPIPEGYKRIVLEHFPIVSERFRGKHFDLALAGHTHGGQVRIPFLHQLYPEFDLDRHDRGLFQTPHGPLYVNPGLGTFFINMRFLCRPEITVLEI